MYNKPYMEATTQNIVIGIALTVFVLYLLYGCKCAYETFHFEVSPFKKCVGGMYNLDVGSELYKFCTDPSHKDHIDDLSCGHGMVPGIKPNFRYTTISDANWENKMCGKVAAFE